MHLKAVLADADLPEHTEAQHAARKAAAWTLQKRVEEAIATVVVLQKERDERAPPSRRNKPARASTTDAEARVMKVPDGGFRPAYDIQLAVDGAERGGPRTVVGVRVTNKGSLTPVIHQMPRAQARSQKRCGPRCRVAHRSSWKCCRSDPSNEPSCARVARTDGDG